MINWYNYFLSEKNSRLTNGHLKAENLYEQILKHDGTTAYCCYFDLEYDSLKLEYWYGQFDSENKKIYTYLPQNIIPENKEHYKPEITFTQYEGIARPALNMVSFDFDAEDPNDALLDVRKFVEWLAIDDIAIFYSGSKGFHVMIPFNYFPLEVNKHLPNQLKDLASLLKETYKTLDTSIYNYNRKFRVPFSAHDKTSRFKTFIAKEYIGTLAIEAIQNMAIDRFAFDFMAEIDPEKERNKLDIFITAFETVKRKSYEVEKERAGTIEKPSPFEKYDNKLCIKKMMESRCDDVGRNNACLRIVNDYYRTGKPKATCEADVAIWGNKNGLPPIEMAMIINNIYDRGQNYNFGCQDEAKSIYCSAKCSIWKKLDPDKRPVTVDMPLSEVSDAKEFITVSDLLLKTFKCLYDDFKREFYGGLIVKQGKEDLFYYDNGLWNYLDFSGTDKIKRRINALTGGKLTSKKIDAFYKMFMIYVPNTPEGVDLFSPRPNCANFNNGTLHLLEDQTSKFYLEFKKHDAKDWITYKIDFDYVEGDTHTNSMFDEMLERVFDGDSDKINAVCEMFGASLIPYFPHLFYLYGEAQSGKSSIMLILYHMLASKNVSSVQPKEFNGFNLESMVGKLVNMVTDVDTRRAISDDIVKQIEDRRPITIRRKNRTDITAPLPSVHIFGGNDLLKSFDGYSQAMNRRWTMLKFDKIYDGQKTRNFTDKVFRHDPQGLINFALIGLRKLVESQGYFTQFASSENELKEWANESDLVQQFLDEALNGEYEVELVKHEDAKIERPALYSIFALWQEKSGYKNNNAMGKMEFFKRMKSKKISVKTIRGARYFHGIGEFSGASNAMKNNDDKI